MAKSFKTILVCSKQTVAFRAQETQCSGRLVRFHLWQGEACRKVFIIRKVKLRDFNLAEVCRVMRLGMKTILAVI
jgi:hypothetical protein